MLTIDIDRVTTRYRLPKAATEVRPRLQRVVDDALRRVLEGELEQHGIDPGAYICVDAVRAVVPVRLGEADGALADIVGRTIADAIHDACVDGSATVVRFTSRAHLLADVAASALGGDFSRSWAWTQAGVWRSDGAMRPDAAANHVLRMLASDAAYAVGVLRFLSRAYPDRLRTLVSRATPRAWEMLAQAVLSTTDGNHRSHGISERTITTHTAVASRAQVTAIATRVLAASALARAALSQWAALPGPVRRSMLFLAVLETEPSAARRAYEVADVLTATWDRCAADDGPDAREHQAAVGLNDLPGARTARVEQQQQTDPQQPSEGSKHEHTLRGRDRADDPDVRSGALPQQREPATDVEPVAAPDAPVDVRTRVSTRHGGLLYLVNLLPQIGVIQAIEADDRWSPRGMRWVLHQLAMRLTGLEPDDPAALVFAGLQPDASPPSELQDPASGDEQSALDAMTYQIAGALRDRLRRVAPMNAQDVLASVRDVFDRRAEIAAEPAWVEARFALEDVSIEIRRAGLDIDPGWIPWLGLVLRFVYE